MKKKFLVTISNEADQLHAVRFLCFFFREISAHSITLLHIYRQNSNGDALTAARKKPGSVALVQPSVAAAKAIDRARNLLAEHHMPIEKVVARTVRERYGKVKDILAAGSRGQFDAIILGKRASYLFQGIFERAAEETFQQIFADQSFVMPIWVCPDADPDRKNVLLCIDGSENSYRAVDHVGSIVSSQKQHAITLFHVENNVGTQCVEFFQRAEKILLAHRVAAERIKRSLVWGLSASGSILNEIKKGEYAVVAVGMKGRTLHGGRNLQLPGKTTTKLINRIEKSSLWCCP